MIFFQIRCRRSPLRMSASRNSLWPLQPSSRSKWILLQCRFFFQSLLYHGTLCASFLTNFHFVTWSLARWRCQSGSTLWRPTTGLFSNSFSISCLLYPVLKAIELLFTGRSLPPMMRIGSTAAQLPWPATCTSGLASFYTFCAPYRSLTEPCALLGHVGNSIFP